MLWCGMEDSTPSLRVTRKKECDESAGNDDKRARHVTGSAASSAIISFLEPTLVTNISDLTSLVGSYCKDYKEGERVVDKPILVGKVSSIDLWHEYVNLSNPPLRIRYMMFDEASFEIYIVELPQEAIHSFFSQEIAMMLARQCSFISSLGPATVNNKEADTSFNPKLNTPGFAGLPQNSNWKNYATVIVEIGNIQPWGTEVGLDAKAKAWFNDLHQQGLEYILCVRVGRHHGGARVFAYKLYDVLALNGVFPDPTPRPRSFTYEPAVVDLDARRVLNIFVNWPLTNGVPNRLQIDLTELRTEALARDL